RRSQKCRQIVIYATIAGLCGVCTSHGQRVSFVCEARNEIDRTSKRGHLIRPDQREIHPATMIRKKEITAAELMAQLRQDPEFCAREKLREEELERSNRLLRIEQTQLLSELREVGVVVDCVWDLVNTETEYPAAIPVLLRHLSNSYTLPVKEGIARALTVEYAGP